MSEPWLNARRYLIGAALLSGVGTLFSGYMSWVRAASGLCVFEPSCPFFFGYPACYTGLALFATALGVSLSALAMSVAGVWPLAANLVVAVAGTAFASTMTRNEVLPPSSHPLGLPTCAWGLVVFVALLVWSIAEATRRAAHRSNDRPLVAR
jgi:hypothetical protein